MHEIFEEYIPDFTYFLVNNQDFSKEELLEHQDEMSLIMLINKIQNKADLFPDELKNKATSLFLLTGKKNDRTKIINSFAEVFESYYTDFIDGNFESLMEKYKALCVTLNSNVTLIQNGETINAVATDITEKGELTVKKEDGTFLNINSGEVSVRGIYGYY